MNYFAGMDIDKTILILTNIVVPIIVALITGFSMSRKYRKEINLLNINHKNDVEKLELQYKHQIELLSQQTNSNIIQGLTSKFFDEAMKNEDIKRSIHRGVSSGFKRNKRG